MGARVRIIVAALAAVLVVAAAVVVSALPAQASARFGYSGFAHGSRVISGLVSSGPQVASFFGCTRQVGLYRSNTLATVNVAGQMVAHSVATKTYTHNDARGDGTTSYGTAADIKVGSLLELTGARSYARAVYQGGSFRTAAWSRFAGVKIGGVAMPGLLNPAPNTTVTVPGLGYAQFNRVEYATTTQSATAKAVAVLLHATTTNPYLPVGANVAVLLTGASVGGPSVALLRGQAYTTRANVGTVVTSGPTSLQTTCLGTNGRLRTVNVAGVTIPNVATVNGLTTTQAGSIRTDLSSGYMTASIASVSLGGGRVKLGAITARAAATKTAAGKYYSSTSSSVGSLIIDGRTVPIPHTPNQQIAVPGLGVLIFNTAARSTGYATVTAVEIRLTALHTTLQLCHAEAGIVS